MVGIICGIVLSFLSVSLFMRWEPIEMMFILDKIGAIRRIVLLLDYNFESKILEILLGQAPLNLENLFNAAFLAWMFTGFMSGAIAKGRKRGFIGGSISFIVVLLIWILLSIISGVDLASKFVGIQFIGTVGGIMGGLSASMIGGVLGGAMTGPYKSTY